MIQSNLFCEEKNNEMIISLSFIDIMYLSMWAACKNKIYFIFKARPPLEKGYKNKMESNIRFSKLYPFSSGLINSFHPTKFSGISYKYVKVVGSAQPIGIINFSFPQMKIFYFYFRGLLMGRVAFLLC